MFEYKARIVSVYDGDTIRADIDLGFGIWTKNQPIRVYGIDAPELGTVAGRAARDFAIKNLLHNGEAGLEVTLRTYKDRKEKYGRYLGSITLPDGTDFSGLMVSEGHAVPYFGGVRETPPP
jgi:micrococcal nuclease